MTDLPPDRRSRARRLSWRERLNAQLPRGVPLDTTVEPDAKVTP